MQLRATHLSKLKTTLFDTLVVGGGINGAVTAAAMSNRGARVALIDSRDFAAVASQHSSNLVWGGIKYMESFEFGLVRKLCRSRNHLIRSYPSSVKETRFFTAHEKGFRHSLWKLYAGTWLYWLIGNGFTQAPRKMSVRQIEAEEPVVDLTHCDGGFEYSDAMLLDNDARFVFQFLRSAMDAGCIAANYVESEGAVRTADGLWAVSVCDKVSGEKFVIRAKTLVNACGAFVDAHNARTGQKTAHRHVLSKGIHLIVDRVTDHRRVLTFFADDGRLFFAIPMGHKTCIGTTDTPVRDPLPQVEDADRDFVLDNINKRLRLRKPLTKADIIAERCGVRPLVVRAGGDDKADWFQMSRKHVVESHLADKHVSIFGGKLTDCLNVGEELCVELEKMGVHLPHRHRKWYGEPAGEVREAFFHQCALLDIDALTADRAHEKLSERLWRLYGEHAFAILDDIRADPKAARILIDDTDYVRGEFAYCARREMVTTLEDFLRRRSKIELTVRQSDLRASRGLMEACQILFGPQAQQQYDDYFGVKPASEPGRAAVPAAA
ncbi:FAD-dependent oxidoreductase [Aquabacterium sp. A7-Y]|uniref:FAD-dependent oxidoreductase n=1 Tax=Aquabacterium sp. A7-Y TaxID=1349605 RepID=UPI00223DF3E7|nr:FAD-dependent oxidoreductase [Aquabacterium sp. A7-Y]MCW7541030.1 FAD-dependent oxidoreductase [Aquabacterium sp. A7-Y]